ncbi:GTP-binding protein, partial [Candidatus Saccharibacteria bacterium]|nr:GTP-binding protein [Candidatus Saccharibacteria bacterium]
LPVEEFRALGVDPEQIYYTSATTGQGIAELKGSLNSSLRGFRSAAARELAREPRGDGRERRDPKRTIKLPLKVALIGRPNVGKSSLFNSLGKKQQAIVSSRQGTTRDVNRVQVKYKGREIEILDTAGLRRPGKREVGIEKFSAIRTLSAIEEADICALLVDATEPHAKLDQALAGQIVEAGKGIIVVLTKTDLVENTDEIIDGLERDFDFLPYAPVLITSAETGKNVTKLFELALEIDYNRSLEIKTSELNKILNEAITAHIPAGLKNTRPKPKYMVQTDICPPWFVVHGHDLGLLHWSWKRFLERKVREKYPFVGTPIMFSFRNDNNRDKLDNLE